MDNFKCTCTLFLTLMSSTASTVTPQ